MISYKSATCLDPWLSHCMLYKKCVPDRMHNWSCAHIKTAQYWRSRSLPVSWLPPAPACIGQWIHTSACRSALLCAATSEKIRVNSSSATRHQSAHWLQRKTETRSGGSKRRVNAKQNNHQKVQKRKKKKPNDKTKDYSSNITGPNKGSCTRYIFLNRTGFFFLERILHYLY